MKSFLSQTLVGIALWGAFFFYEGEFQPLHIFICAAVIALFYFLLISQYRFYLFAATHIILLVTHVFVSATNNPFPILLIIYFSILATKLLTNKEFKLLAISTMIALTASLIIDLNRWPALLFISFFYYIANLTNELLTDRNDQRKLYEELLGEYRTLKRLALASEEEARYQERTKIARDIHDSVGHKLTALLMQLEVLSIQNGESEVNQDHLNELKKLAKESLEETRYAVRTLKSSEQEGISTILQLIKKLEAESHILVHFTTKQGILNVKLTNDQSVVLYRVIQEGLTNAMRHAHSKEVQVILGRTATLDIEFLIKNRVYNAKPFEEGFGLSNMRKRVEELGGTLSIYQTENEFVIRGMIPIQNEVVLEGGQG